MGAVLGITAARGGSKGVPNKNTRMCAGKPLLAWTIEEAKRCNHLAEYVVSTDSKEIASVASEFGAKVVIRPGSLAEDWTPMVDVLQHATKYMEAVRGDYYDAVADIRCTNPLKLATDIDGALEKLFETEALVVCGVSELDDHHPSRIKRIVHDRLVDFSWPEPASGLRQDLTPKAYIRNGSIYAVNRHALFEGVLFSGDDVRPWVMPADRGVNVDSEIDLLLAEQVLLRRQ